MKVFVAVLMAVLYEGSALHSAQPPVPYSAVQVDRFVAARGVAFPTGEQTALVDAIAREISLAFQTVIILRQADAAPGRHALRISGVITRFKRFSASVAAVTAQVWWIDGDTGEVLLNREMKGMAGESFGKKIAKICNAAHLVESNQ
jgi:hypothetical protein